MANEGSSRRTFLRTTGLAGAGVMSLGAMDVALPRSAEAVAYRPDVASPRFTIAVVPDTQYLFDLDRGDPEPLQATFRFVLDAAEDHNVVFLAHLGDLTENGQASEFASIDKVFSILDRKRFGYSVLAGNHDIGSSTDDQRGDSAYLRTFGPHRFGQSPTFQGSSPGGYNSYHLFRAAGREWMVLALDWRPSAGGLAWARSVLAAHPRTPVILTTHELVVADGGTAELSEFGQRLWSELIFESDQIFLTLNGHFWPPGRLARSNAAGHDVHLHLTNYQDRYYGGAGMVRMYSFDLARNTIDVRTLSPWILDQSVRERNALESVELERTGPQDAFSVPIDFSARFAGFAPVPPRPPRPASAVLVRDTVAYWRFDGAAAVPGSPLPSDAVVLDLSGSGNDLRRVTLPGSADSTLTWSADHRPGQPAHASLRFLGARGVGSYLRTADDAPLNRMTFARGYTIEAFLKLPADFDGNHAWCGLFTRMGSGRDLGLGQSGDDPAEPLATLNLNEGGALQWATYATNRDAISTNWGHELPRETWWHAAVVNDGRHTTMYVDGCELLRNPSTPAPGLRTTGEFWMLGAYHYDRVIERGFYGWIGDVRIVNRALPVRSFML